MNTLLKMYDTAIALPASPLAKQSVSAVPTGVPGAPAVILPKVQAQWTNVPFAPGVPLEPWFGGTGYGAERAREEPRSFDYVPSVNVTISPRIPYGLMPFAALQYYAENIPEVAMCIRILIEQLKAMTPVVLDPKDEPTTVPELQWMTSYPDQYTAWPVWLGRFLWNVLAYDAGALFQIRDDNNKVIGLRVIDGSSVMVTIDSRGEQPSPPAPAFTQIVQGTPYIWMTTEQLWYRPRQARSYAPYGRTAVEDSLRSVQYMDALWTHELDQYTEGNVPEMLVVAPEDWTPDQVSEFEKEFNGRTAGNSGEKRRLRMVPFGFTKLATKVAPWNESGYRVALARIAYNFGLPSSEIGEQHSGLGGKGFQEEGTQQYSRMGVAPLRAYVESPFNDCLRKNGYHGYKFILRYDTTEIDTQRQHDEMNSHWTNGLTTRNQTLEGLGLPPVKGALGDMYLIPSTMTQVSAADLDQAGPVGGGVNLVGGKPSGGGGVERPDNGEEPKSAVPEGGDKAIKDGKTQVDKLQKVDFSDGIMAAFMLAPETAQALSSLCEWPEGSEPTPLSEFHITLAYFGNVGDVLFVQDKLETVIAEFCNSYVAPIDGVISGIGRFVDAGNSGKSAVYASFDAPGLPDFYHCLVDELTRQNIPIQRDHGFTAHITLAYIPKDASMPTIDLEPIPVAFNSVWVAWANQYTEFRFGRIDKAVRVRGLELLKHCGVCAEDDIYYGQPVSQVVTAEFPHQGANETDIVAISPYGKESRPGLWKPASGELPELNQWIGGPQYVREEAAFIIDRTLGFYLVPVTYVTEIDGELGSVQHYVRGNKEAKLPVESGYSQEWIEKAAVLDFICGQIDRGGHNWLTHPDDPKRPILIDNGLTFPTDDGSFISSVFIDAYRGHALEESTINAVLYLFNKGSTWRDVADLVGKQAADNSRKRAGLILESGYIPTVG